MKAVYSLLTALCLLLSLCACGQTPQATDTTAASGTSLPTESEPLTSEPGGTSLPPETEPPVSEPTETTPPDDGSYLQRILNCDQPIFNEPSYDSTVAGSVSESGTYTILEEVTDEEGNLWGRLKSGAGWVDLTAVLAFNESTPLVSAGYIREDLVNSKDFVLYGEKGEHGISIVFHFYSEVCNVRLFSLIWDEGGYGEGEEMLWLEKADPDKPLAAWLSFPGDLSMYAISVTDSDAKVHTFVISQSGRNGMLLTDNITP